MTELLEAQQDDPVRESPPVLRRAPSRWMSPAWVSIASFGFVAALCAWMGFYAMFNSFAGWDDEGTILSVVNAFAHHGGLYTHVSSPFGPFYFESVSTIFSWLPLSLDVARMTTLVVTILTSIGLGVAVKMLTRSVIAGVATQAGTFMLMILSFQVEALHPTVIVSFLFAIALLALALMARGHRSAGCTLLGATVAALLLTIINVGVFAMIAFLFTGLTLAPPARNMRFYRVAAAALFICTPFLLVLVGGHGTDSWVVKYELIVALSAAGVVVVTFDRDFQGAVRSRDVTRFLLGASVMGALVLVVALLTGTHPLDLVRGILIYPARFSNATGPLPQSAWTEVWGIVCLVGAVMYRRRRNRRSPTDLLVAWVHVVAGLVILYFSLLLASTRPHSPAMFLVALPLVFLAAVPPVGASDSERIARVGVVALAVLEALVAYPLAGAQVRWAQLLIVPAGVLCLHDGVHQLHPSIAVLRRLGNQAFNGLLALVVVLSSLGWLALVWHGDLWTERQVYVTNTKLNLPGSNLIHLPSYEVSTLSAVTRAIRSECSTFIAVPGLNSFYFWTGEKPPTDDWLNVWFYSADVSLQRQVAQLVETRDRSGFCILNNPHWWSGWAQGNEVPQLPLTRLVERFMKQNSSPQLFLGATVPPVFTFNNDYRLYFAQKAAKQIHPTSKSQTSSDAAPVPAAGEPVKPG